MPTKSDTYDKETRTPLEEAVKILGSEVAVAAYAKKVRTFYDWKEFGVPARVMERIRRDKVGLPETDLRDEPGQARLSHPPPPARHSPTMPEAEEAEMRVARLCAAVHNVVKKEDPEIEIIILSAAKKAVPDLFDHWAEAAAKEITEVRDLLTRTLTKIRRRAGR